MPELAILPGYRRLDGPVPVLHAPGSEERARELHDYLRTGVRELSTLLAIEPPPLEALLVPDEGWREAPRENEKPYPPGLPYYTRAADPPALVIPEELSPAFRPRTAVLLPLTVWHELAHAFLLRESVVRTPAWFRELVPQAAAAAVARRTRLPLGEHLSLADPEPGFTVRGFRGPADAGDQMAFQNLLLRLGDAALAQFGEGFLKKLVRALWEQEDVVDEDRAGKLLAEALGPGGREWLDSRPEF